MSVLFIASQIDYIRCALFLNSSWFSFLAISIFIVEVEFFFFFSFYSFCFLLFLLRFFFSYLEFILIHGSFNFSFGFSFFEFLFRQISSCFYCCCLSEASAVWSAWSCLNVFNILIFDFWYHIMHHIMKMDGEKMNNITSDRCLLRLIIWLKLDESIDRSISWISHWRSP